MSDVDVSKANHLESNVKSDHDVDRKLEKEGDDVNGRGKTGNEEESSRTKDEESQKKQNNNEMNDNAKINVAADGSDVNSRRDDRNGVSCTTNSPDKREKDSKNKSTPQKEEKSANKKKIQKEGANGRVKDDCEKKKRKKKKKKKGGSCDDEAKSGKDGETSLSKDRSDNKNSVGKIESSNKEVLEHVQKPENSENIVNETIDNRGSMICNDESLLTNTNENMKENCDRCVEEATICANEDKKSEELTEVKSVEEDVIRHNKTDAEIKPDNATTSETKGERDKVDNSVKDNILNKEIHSNGSADSESPLEQSQLTNEENSSSTTNSSDETTDRDNESTKAIILDTIIESDETTVTNEEKKYQNTSGLKEGHDMNLADDKKNGFNKDGDETEMYVDKIDGSAVMHASDVDNGVSGDDAASGVVNMTHDQLHQRLQEQRDAMTRLQTRAHAQQVKANLLTTSLRAKLRRKDQELLLIKSEHEQQVSAVISHLLYLEGQMQKEHNDILEVLHEKDDVIRRQKAAIEDLVAKNNRYLQALKESHGYSSDNGLVKPQNDTFLQNGNISIQDHGNRVILRGNKNKNGEKAPASGHKVRFSAMKDMLRRHKSSLELYQHEPLETLMETTLKYGSEENLVLDRRGQSSLVDRKERCRSLIDYPVSLFDLEEGQTESPDSCFSEDFSTPTIARNDSTSSLVTLSDKTARNYRGVSSASAYGFNELSKSRSVPHGLPTVAENDASPNLRGRPHSLPSVEMLAKDNASTTATTTTTAATSASNSKVNTPANLSTTSSSPPSESNAFKTFKNVFKRKGSKKKRAAAVTSGKEQTDALKQHFKKYDMT